MPARCCARARPTSSACWAAELDAGVRRLDSAVAIGDAAQAASLQEVTASLDGRVNAQATRFDQALVDATQAQAAQVSGVRADFNAAVDDQAAHFSADVTRLDNAVASGDRAQTDALTVVHPAARRRRTSA